jgi:alkylated DNA repair dioxygenase AlkB
MRLVTHPSFHPLVEGTLPDDDSRCLVVGRRPSGFRLIADFIQVEEQHAIEHWIRAHFDWEKRRHGSLPPCEQYPDDGPIPAWAELLGRRMVGMGIFRNTPDHVVVRRYDRGRGARPHIDKKAYGPVVAGLTLVSSRTFHLTRPGRRSRIEALLLPGDLYVMSGSARYRWKHSIPAVLDDDFRGKTFSRSDGFSVTWRYAPRPPRHWWWVTS